MTRRLMRATGGERNLSRNVQRARPQTLVVGKRIRFDSPG